MNRVHIILWGQESGLISKDQCASEQTIAQLEDFANLVAAHEREVCAKLFPEPHKEYFGRDIQDAIRTRRSNDTPKL
jgi:hypothetical protein